MTCVTKKLSAHFYSHIFPLNIKEIARGMLLLWLFADLFYEKYSQPQILL